MVKIKVGITGQNGFIGTHLYNYLGLKENIKLIPFEKSFFDEISALERFVNDCDVIVHLAALNRHDDPQIIYETNVTLVEKLIAACQAKQVRPHIVFSSSTQEENDTLYGRSKRKGREMLQAWAKEAQGLVTGLVIPNVFGPFGKPFYNSVVATFCHLLTHDGQPKIDRDADVFLIYVNELAEEVFGLINNPEKQGKRAFGALRYVVPAPYKKKVSVILQLLESYQKDYVENGAFPALIDPFEKALFNTFRCYIPADYYPHPFKLHVDNRGQFVEIARTNTPGQTSYSTTKPGVTRGNHFHTRKAERFAVIKGKARIQLRKIGTDEVIEYYLNGDNPSYVDMPIWYTHNIKNIGDEELVTLFWINEPFNLEDPDTYFVEV